MAQSKQGSKTFARLSMHIPNRINADTLKTLLPEYLQAIGCPPKITANGTRLTICCPLHVDTNPSFTANLKDGVWLWGCYPCGVGGTVIDLHTARTGLSAKSDFATICREVAELVGLNTTTAQAAPMRTAPDLENEAEKKARQRKGWPTFMALKPAGIETIAKLRHMMPDAVDLAHQHGFLKAAEIDGHRCFIIHEGTFAQARRLDGLPLTMHDGSESKPKNLLGSQGAFIGQKLLGQTTHVLLVEGVIGLVEALAAFLLAEDVRHDWSIIAATSASSRFARDPELLARLAGRHVRIVPDNDEKGTGYNAAASWMADLKNAGATVDAKALPDGCKDLGDIIAAPEFHKETLNELFQ